MFVPETWECARTSTQLWQIAQPHTRSEFVWQTNYYAATNNNNRIMMTARALFEVVFRLGCVFVMRTATQFVGFVGVSQQLSRRVCVFVYMFTYCAARRTTTTTIADGRYSDDDDDNADISGGGHGITTCYCYESHRAIRSSVVCFRAPAAFYLDGAHSRLHLHDNASVLTAAGWLERPDGRTTLCKCAHRKVCRRIVRRQSTKPNLNGLIVSNQSANIAKRVKRMLLLLRNRKKNGA